MLLRKTLPVCTQVFLGRPVEEASQGNLGLAETGADGEAFLVFQSSGFWSRKFSARALEPAGAETASSAESRPRAAAAEREERGAFRFFLGLQATATRARRAPGRRIVDAAGARRVPVENVGGFAVPRVPRLPDEFTDVRVGAMYETAVSEGVSDMRSASGMGLYGIGAAASRPGGGRPAARPG
eukprot:SAG22_NODE_44_length_24912_cov_33.648894_4_plen_184_part_00